MTEREFNKIFSENLLYYMAKTGTSRRELADLLNVSITSISNWCRGEKTPRIDKIDRMCAHFGIERSDLMLEYPGDIVPESLLDDILTFSEKQLLDDFRQLNDDGQGKVCEYTSDLVASGRYSLDMGDGSRSGSDEESA